jgi:hypothetical protein
MLTFEELNHSGRRWPIADCGLPGERGAFLFCSEAVARDGRPYGADHMLAAYKLPPVQTPFPVREAGITLCPQ